MTVFKPLMAAGLALLLSGTALADSATVNITGRILTSACQPDVNPLNVPLGTINRSVFGTKGATSPGVDFQLRLKNCPAEISQVKVQFDGTSASGDSNALALTTSTKVASGVGVLLQDAAGNILPPGQLSALMPIKGGSGTINNLAFSARYIATSDTVTGGSANASATFTIWYNN